MKESGFEFREDVPKYGNDVTIRNIWQRHTQKASAEIFAADKDKISTSSISPGGASCAEERGRIIDASTHGAKGYRSESPRTLETFDALMKGYQDTNPDVPVREAVRVKKELMAAEGNKEWMLLYDKKWSENKAKLLQEGIASDKYPDVPFKELSPNQQEEIAEAAEEPVIREWLDDPDSKLAELYPPREQAKIFAKLFDRRHERMAGKLNNNSEIDLFHNTHKTTTEPFLASGVLIRASDEKRITKIFELGGSLQILDDWESLVKTDSEGNPKTIITIRGEEYRIDQDAYNELLGAEEGV